MSQVDPSLGLPGALEHAAGARRERKHVTWLYEVLRPGFGGDRHLDGVRPVGGRDARRHAFAGLDRHGEGRLQPRLVLARHRGQFQLGAAQRRQRETDQATTLLGHEVDVLRGRELRGQREITLVLAVLVVADDDHPALAQLLEGFLDRGERPRGLSGGVAVAPSRGHLAASLVCVHQNPASASISQVSPAPGLRPATNA